MNGLERVYELLLADGKITSWRGKDGVDAATRYVDAHRSCPGVMAWRHPRVALVPGVAPGSIIG